MEPHQWERVQAVFSSVADLPREQQNVAVARASGEDAEVEREVLELLREDSAKNDLLDAELGAIAGNALQSDFVRSLVQQQIGPYRLLRLLGEGGMGVVYLAERTDIGGLVAVKLLRDAWISPMRRSRFLGEQRTLARLNHPAIAHIYDAGTTKDGTPWFVMEFADGRPITEHLDQQPASVEDALRLFCQVCEAVQYAHGLAIIHRDLKPSNIFITKAAEVKLLDFGIAKDLDAEGGESQRTIQGLRLMSPAYAAPEQLIGGAVGVFTDIYALGVLLYELLTGELPGKTGQDAERLQARPSQKAKHRFALSRREWDEIDLICLTAMLPDPALRYRSVDAFSRDIQAYLDGRPLEGRRNSRLYLAGKFVRRNRTVLLSAALVALVLAAAAILFTVRLATARNAAINEAARSNRILDFTEELFDGGDSTAGPELNLKVSEVLGRGKRQALSLTGDPRLRTQLLTVLGSAYGKLGQLDVADELLSKASSEAFDPGEVDNHVKSLESLAELRRQERRLPEAEELLRRAISISEKGNNDRDTQERLRTDLGSVLALGGRYQPAEAELKSALNLRPKHEPANLQLAEELTQLAEVDHYLGSYDLAKQRNQQALDINIAFRGPNHPAVAENLNNLGAIAFTRADYGAAESLQRQALVITQNWYGLDHPAVADALTALSAVLVDDGKLDEADAALRRALTIQTHTYGKLHSSVANTHNGLGTLAYMRDQDAEAEKQFRSAIAIWERTYGPGHQFVGVSYANLAGVYMDRKDYPTAERMCRKALAIYSSAFSGENINSGSAHVRLGRILLREGKLSEAETESLAGYHYFSAQGSPSASYLKGARKDLIKIESGLGHLDLSKRYAAEAASAQ